MRPGAMFDAGPYGGQLFDPGPREAVDGAPAPVVVPCLVCGGTGCGCEAAGFEAPTFDGLEPPAGSRHPRYIGRCRACRTPMAVQAETPVPGVSKLVRWCGCGHAVELQRVAGTYNAGRVCDARCMGAIGPQCSCSCGGRNHGGRYG